MKLDLANQRMLLVVLLLAFEPIVALLCVDLTAWYWLLDIEPLVAESVGAKLNLTRTGMHLNTMQLIQRKLMCD